MIEEQRLDLPFDYGLRHGLMVYVKRLGTWALYVLWNSVTFAVLYLIANRDRVDLILTDIMFFWLLGVLLTALVWFFNHRVNGKRLRFLAVLITVSAPILLIALCGVFLIRAQHYPRTAGWFLFTLGAVFGALLIQRIKHMINMRRVSWWIQRHAHQEVSDSRGLERIRESFARLELHKSSHAIYDLFVQAERAVSELASVSDTSDPSEHLAAAKALTGIEYLANSLDLTREETIPRIVWTLIKLLGDRSDTMSQRALVALVSIGDPAVDRLIEALRRSVADALGSSGWKIRRLAARALGLIGNKSAIKPLEEAAMDESDNAIRNELLLAIERIRGSASHSVHV